MSETNKWFEQEVLEPPKKSNHANNWPFQLDVDQDCRISILNADNEPVPPVHYHPIFANKRVNRVLCTAAEHLGGSCRGCDHTAAQEEGSRWKTEKKQEYAYSVLSDFYDKTKGVKKCLRLSSVSDDRKIKGLRDTVRNKMDKDGLQYAWLECTRPSSQDKAPRIGNITQYLTEVDKDKFDEDMLTAFTYDEILQQFVSDPDEASEIYDILESETGPSKPKIRKVN